MPRYLWLVEEFPTTVTGKIQKFRMRAIAEAWLRGEPTAVEAAPCSGVPA